MVAFASVLACPGAQIASVQWRQVDGPALALQSARSQALSLTPPSAGRYAFSVEFTDGEPTWINKDGGDANLVMNALVRLVLMMWCQLSSVSTSTPPMNA